MRRGVWVSVALFAVACEPSSLDPGAPARNVWVTADAGGGVRDPLPKDASTRRDAALVDASRRDARPTDGGRPDAPGRDTTPGVPAHDAATDDAGAQTCGPHLFICTPYVCDVDAGTCRSSCNGPADCTNGRPCVNNTCQLGDLTAVCTTDSECLTGFCVDGTCCNSACTGPCRTCNLAGAIGTCEQVPAGGIDPRGICATGSFCDSNAACVLTSCTADEDCGDLAICTAGSCQRCQATCVSDADCVAGAACAHRNSCTYCSPRPDAGAASH